MRAFAKLASRLAWPKQQTVPPVAQQQAAPAAPEEPPAPLPGSMQVLSDLHLEVCTQYATFQVPATGAPYLVLAGDIGRLVDYEPLLGFLAGLVAAYRRVFYVLGNHEFYTLTYDEGLRAAERLEKEPRLAGKLTILHRTRWDEDAAAVDAGAPRLTILGCTLWTHVVPEARDAVARSVSDFQYIRDWTVDTHNQAHADEVAWLRGQVEAVRGEIRGQTEPETENRAVVVVTHHVPTVEGTSRPKYAASPWASAFATELIVPAGAWTGVSAWVYGHTHYSNDFVREGVRLVANQRGYVFPPNPQAIPVEQTDRAGKKGFRVIERTVDEDEDGEHAFDARKTISY